MAPAVPTMFLTVPLAEDEWQNNLNQRNAQPGLDLIFAGDNCLRDGLHFLKE